MFWQLLKESVILQATLTVLIWGATVYLAVTSQPVPDFLLNAAYIVLGFYFGSKLAMAQREVRVIDRRQQEE